MHTRIPKLAVVLCVCGSWSGAQAAPETLRMGGTGAATEMLRQIGGEFTAATGIAVNVVSGLGSSGALDAVADSKLDIAVSARALTEKEVAAGLRQILVLQTAFVFATSKPKPNSLNAADLAAIYAAPRPTWADGTPIRIILRPRSEADTALMGKLFVGMDRALETARQRHDIPIAATEQENAEIGQRVRGSLIGMTLTQFTAELLHHDVAGNQHEHVHVHLNLVPIDGVQPTLANFESGAYPYAIRFYFVVASESPPAAQRFTDYLLSPQGLTALRESATLPDGKR